jgi:hypothetical protein
MADDTVLTDAELETAYYGDFAKPCGLRYDALRAVEAAVLAKCVKITDGSYCIFRDGYPLHTEAEARTRERQAYHMGYQDASPRGWDHNALREKCDRRYPLPPRTITLSSGERVTAESASVFDKWWVRLNATSVLTAADIAALAELIAKPTEASE